MDVLGLTNFAQIRGVLTVSSTDLPDEVLESYAVEDDLHVALTEMDKDWESVASAGDTELKRFLRLYAKYYCAGTLAGMAEVFVLTRDTDGANEGQRAGTGLDKLQGKLLGKASQFKADYLDKKNGTATAAVPSIISRSPPDRDVITEARSNAS